MGYCLLYPDHLFRVDPFSSEVCLVPELSALACHSNVLQVEVSDAGGLSASQVADEAIALAGTGVERSTATIGGEDAVILHGVPAQDLLRDVLIVHEGQLYRVRFVLPDPTDFAAVERFDRLYAMVIESFAFLPSTQ